MTVTTNPNQVVWIETQPRRPLCERAVAWPLQWCLSDGSVNFCATRALCNSAMLAKSPLKRRSEEREGQVREIRSEPERATASATMPTPSCPIYRGDELNYIYDRMEGSNSLKATGTHRSPCASARTAAGKRASRELRHFRIGDSRCDLRFSYRGEPLMVDLFVGIRCPESVIRFLPGFEEYPVPLSYIEFSQDQSPLQV